MDIDTQSSPIDEDPGSTSWKWQLKHRITTKSQLEKLITLTDAERDAIDAAKLPFSITPYYSKLLHIDAIRKSIIPTVQEFEVDCLSSEDPLKEDEMRPCKSILHRYPDRVCLLATPFCSTICRYCTRSRIVSGEECQYDVNEGIEYIKSHPEIRDVLVTGGDPLTMSTQALDVILNKLRSISHVEILRIGTKVPAVLPMRIDDELVSMLQKYAPLYINIHFIHPSELTTESKAACLKLAKAGIPLGSQTVLLKDINDDPVIMKELMQKLLTVCVKPYYIYLCDQTTGNKHFRTNVKTGINIIENLRGWTSGLAVPHLIIDSAEGKIPISPKYAEKTGNKWVLRGYKNKQFLY